MVQTTHTMCSQDSSINWNHNHKFKDFSQLSSTLFSRLLDLGEGGKRQEGSELSSFLSSAVTH